MTPNSSSQNARVVQVNVNPKGGVPKHRVADAEITINGVIGDKQRDRRYHGGPERAVCLYSYERIRELQDEGHSINCGTTGENLTISGLDWASLGAGDRLRIGEQVRLEITRDTTPCYKIGGSFIDSEFTRIAQKVHPGWSRFYARVLVEGRVAEGDAVELESSQADDGLNLT
jgi:MOSC domain-containing protein YiiM